MKKLIFPIILILVAVGIAVYFFILKKKDTALTVVDSKPIGSTSKPKAVISDELFPLKRGSKNELVKNVQTFLNWKYKAGLTVDGDFGAKTETACIKFFKVNSISRQLFDLGIKTSFGL